MKFKNRTGKTSAAAKILSGGRLTKWKGRTASFAPHILASGISIPAFAAALALGVALAPSTALAGSCSLDTNGEFICSGPADPNNDVEQLLSADPLIVNTASGFGISTGAGSAFNLNGNSGITFTDANMSQISGNTSGILAVNMGGALSISTNGSVSGNGGTGINAFNFGTSLTINANDTAGKYNGIYAANYGTGALSITSTGTATGTIGSGIFAINSANGTDLTIMSNNASGGTDGITANNYGSGALSIISTGTAMGTNGDGISAINSANGTDLMIMSNDAVGRYNGIYAVNTGTGALTITSTGTAIGETGNGIFAINSYYGTDLTITSNNAYGIINGIYANNYGTGALSITSTGTATGTIGSGIFAINSANGTDLTIMSNNASGGTDGITANNNGSGALSIISTGTAMGTNGSGISAINSANGTGLTIMSNDASGGTDGITARNYGTDLTITSNNASGGNNGIFAQNDGTGALAITSTGTATGTYGSGIIAINSGTSLTIDANDSMGYADGITAINNGTGALSITSAGTAYGKALSGIYAANLGTSLTINANDSYGYVDGITAINNGTGALTINSTGTANGATGSGIYAVNSGNGTDLTIMSNDAVGFTNGINAVNSGTGALSITSSGTAYGANNSAIYASNSSNGTSLTVNSNDAVGYADGITAINNGSGALSITSTGMASGTALSGIYARNNGTSLTINANDSMGNIDGITAVNFGSDALVINSTGMAYGATDSGIFGVNLGTDLSITAKDAEGSRNGIYAANYGTGALSITSTGTAIGGMNGIYARNYAYGTNLSINAANTSGNYAISALNLGTGALTINSTGLADGGTSGINASNSGTNLMISALDTAGDREGIYARNSGSGSLSIVSTGTATGKGEQSYGVKANNDAGTDLTIRAVNTSGGLFGINAINNGTGALAITSTGLAQASTVGSGLSSAGIYANNSANGTDLVIMAKDSTGGKFGIGAVNSGTGAIIINSTGTATSTAMTLPPKLNPINGSVRSPYAGIYARNGATGTDLMITSNNATGGEAGIYALNSGTGALEITSTGTATGALAPSTPFLAQGQTYAGIYAKNDYSGTDLMITSNNATGGVFGIKARNGGSGDTLIKSTGMASGGYTGLRVDAGSYTGDLTVMAADTSGGNNGLVVGSYGTGKATVISTGTAKGDKDSGIFATDDDNGTDLIIMSNNAMGGLTGIQAEHSGKGALVITSTGTASAAQTLGSLPTLPGQGRPAPVGRAYVGIYASNYVDSTDMMITSNNASGAVSGIVAKNYGTGAITINSTGSAMGTASGPQPGTPTLPPGGPRGYFAGIAAVNASTGTDVMITAKDASGGYDGIYARNDGTGKTAITVTGKIMGGSGAGINTVSGTGSAVAITVASTASVGATSGVAIQDGTGDATLTVAKGAKLTGDVFLGDGSDTLNIANGADLTGVKTLSGGIRPQTGLIATAGLAGDVDTLNLGADFAGSADNFSLVNLDASGGDFTLSGTITGTAAVTKTGAGVTTVSGMNAFTGPTSISGGILNVTGSITASPITIMNGGTLSGTGTVSSVTGAAGSTLTAGGMVGQLGTLTVNGNINLAAGSTLLAEASATGGNDLIIVSGTAMLNGAVVVAPTSAMAFGSTITFVQAGSITGNFTTAFGGAFGAAFRGTIVNNGTTLSVRLDPNSLILAAGRPLTGNALSFATAFDAAVQRGFNPQQFFNLFLQGTNLPVALNQVTGEIHSAERRVALEETRFVREAALDRLSDVSTAPNTQTSTNDKGDLKTTLFMQALAGSGKAQADTIGQRFTSDRRGYIFGGDVALASGFKIGGLFSYLDSDLDFARIDKSSIRSVGGALYAGYRQEGGGLGVGLGASVADLRFRNTRNVTIPNFVQTLNSRVTGTSYQFFGELSYDLAASENVRVAPFARISYAKLDTNGFKETGGVAALAGAGQKSDLTRTSIGVRGTAEMGPATLTGSIGYQNTSGDRRGDVNLAVSGVTQPFGIRSTALDRNAATIDLQAGFRLAPNVKLSGGYSGVIGKNNKDHGGRASITFAF